MRYKKNSTKSKTLFVLKYFVLNTNKDNPASASTIITYLSSLGIPCERKSIYQDIVVFKNMGINIVCTGHAYYYDSKEGDFLHEIANGLQ